MEQTTKKCPYCGEEIQAVAKKCRYCGEWLAEDKPIDGLNQPAAVAPTIAKEIVMNEKQRNAFQRSCFYNCFLGGIKRSFDYKGLASRKDVLFLPLFSLLIVAFFLGCMFFCPDPDLLYLGFSESTNHPLFVLFSVLAIVAGVLFLIPGISSFSRRSNAVEMPRWRGISCLLVIVCILGVFWHGSFNLAFLSDVYRSGLISVCGWIILLFGVVVLFGSPFVRMLKKKDDEGMIAVKFNYIDIIIIVAIVTFVILGFDHFSAYLSELQDVLNELNDLYDYFE